MEIMEIKKFFKKEIAEAIASGYNYAETDGEFIHFCRVDNNSTPINWSWGPDCDQFDIY